MGPRSTRPTTHEHPSSLDCPYEAGGLPPAGSAKRSREERRQKPSHLSTYVVGAWQTTVWEEPSVRLQKSPVVAQVSWTGCGETWPVGVYWSCFGQCVEDVSWAVQSDDVPDVAGVAGKLVAGKERWWVVLWIVESHRPAVASGAGDCGH